MTTIENGTPSKHDESVNGNGMKEPCAMPTPDSDAGKATPSASVQQDTAIEQAFFFGLTIDDALNSSDNLPELFYNACKYNHLELVKRCVDEKHIDVNESVNNDYPLCIAR